MRCHSQALTIKLRRDAPLGEVEALIGSAHEWVRVVPNNREASLAGLTPAAVTGTLQVRRMLRILLAAPAAAGTRAETVRA
jgi:aspartate-semialdehyde dehydrogenase